jgi:predicted phosphodiesterase
MKVLTVGDLHLPFVHPGYFQFIKDLRDKFDPNIVLFIGDVADNHAIAPNWDANPNGMSAEDEMGQAMLGVAKWHKEFPDALVCIGNHDNRHIRSARKAGLNDKFLKGYAEAWGTPTWTWALSHEIDGVRYEHGTGTSGKNAALNLAIQQRQSVVIGHTHTYAGVQFHSNHSSLIFGLNVGCGIDPDAYAFEYASESVTRPVLGAGFVEDGDPTTARFIPMAMGPRQKYHRSRFERKSKKA